MHSKNKLFPCTDLLSYSRTCMSVALELQPRAGAVPHTFFVLSTRLQHRIFFSVQSPAMSALEAIRWRQGPPAALQLLDQRLLPLQTVYIDISGPKAAWHAIKVGRVPLMALTQHARLCARGS